MKLIVDSGSTKADWVAIYPDNTTRFFSTLGLNPEVLRQDEVISRLDYSIDILEIKDQVTEIHFYGSGCGTDRMKSYLKNILEEYFPQADILVVEDTYAAAYATTPKNEKAIVCILGTGSNCSYFDGQKLHQKVQSLGYLIMDDAGGVQFGRLLLREYYYNQMPAHIAKAFADVVETDADYIKNNLYKKPNPNAYLAGIAKFIFDFKEDAYIKTLIEQEITRFIKYHILQYPEAYHVPINFIGSLAYYLQPEITKLLQQHQLNIGTVYQKPIDGLITYHKN
ncbi:N-acetylglucosamine kinase [Flavobacterium agricola]|uniref:N-acetylglucosamine kinase n=1 Tax=Flavobacterium agricola TaxID=2870839 RepID=A0ABY6M3H9_9FLAO|nr:N-acetylglucosamine kinase [Flavobacterium agricola]UYW02050.1 N-acetylglucosamine kinase [Flavobacterium agricola]